MLSIVEELDNEPTPEESTKPLTHSPMEKLLEMMLCHLKQLSMENLHYNNICMNVVDSVGKRVQFPIVAI